MSRAGQKRAGRLIVVLVVFLLFAPSFVSAQTVFFNTQTIQVAQNTDFSLPLRVNDVQNLFGLGFDINFNPALFEYVSTQEGNFLSQGCGTSMMTTPVGQGRIAFGISRLGSACGGISGSGLVATFNFRSKAQNGTGAFSFLNNGLCILQNGSCNYNLPSTWTPIDITVGTSDTAAPSVPANLSASGITSSQVTISWTASTDNIGVAGYRIYRNGIQIATSNTNSYLDSGLSPQTTYSYTVAAYDAAGNVSGQSSPFSVTTLAVPDTTPPVISSVLANSITQNSAVINWTTNEASDSQVEYGLTTSYGLQTSINPILVTSHSVALSGLAANTTYHYRVRSKDASVNPAVSADGVFTTTQVSDTAAPSIPTGLAASGVTSAQVSLSWNASIDNVGVVGYRIYRNGVQIATTDSNSYVNSGLSPQTTYSYTVAAYDAAINVSSQSVAVQVTTLSVQPPPPQPVVPSPPTNLRAACNSSGNQATLSWDNVFGATSYYLRVDNISNNSGLCLDGWHCSDPPDKIVNSHSLNSYAATIVPGQRYNWWVHSGNAFGVSGAVSASFTCYPLLPPPPPPPPLPPPPPVPGENQPPVTGDDRFSTIQNVTLTIDFSQLLANDFDTNGDEFSIIDVAKARGGWVYFEKYSRRSGKVVFDPYRNFVGQASFSYRVRDSRGASNWGNVVINVSANQGPIAGNDSFSTSKNQRLTIPISELLKNDSDPDGGQVNILYVYGGRNGYAYFQRYTRRSGNIIFVPRWNYTGTASFIYSITDSSGKRATATVTINVQP